MTVTVRAREARLKVVVLGATRGMGRALARRLIERRAGRRARWEIDLVLLGRDREDLERSARDLEVRGDREVGSIGTAVCDLTDRTSFAPALDAAEERLGGLDAVVVTAADFAVQDALEADSQRAARLLDVNVTGTIAFCEEARRRLLRWGEAGGRRVLCVFSSVAGDRPRKPVVLYGASKAALSYYLEGLDRRFWDRGLRVVTVKPGFVKTSMTAGLDPPPFAGEPEQVARDVAKAIDRAVGATGRDRAHGGRPGVVYTPWPWRWILLVIRNLPGAVMRRIGF